MKNRCSVVCVILLSVFLFAAAANANGPQSPLYLTDGPSGVTWGVQGPVVLSGAQHYGNEYPIAIANGRLRTLSYIPGGFGAEYNTTFGWTGSSYPYPLGPTTNIYDGATNAVDTNFMIEYNTGTVYALHTDWTNPTPLFTLGFGYLDITYDATDNSLWVANFNGSAIEHRTLFGTLMSSFPVPFTSITCLALDPADNTLWVGSQNAEGSFYQYSKTGTQLSSVFYPAISSSNTLGGEFETFAPTTIQEVNGNGKLGKNISFSLWDVENEQVTPQFLEGLVGYQDKGAKVSFQTGRITTVQASGNEAYIYGNANLAKTRTLVFFTIHVIGNHASGTNDFFSISLSNGYSASGNLLKGGFINVTPSN